MNTVDAGIAVRHVPGLLPPIWSWETAQRGAEAITKSGLRAVAVRNSDVPDLAEAETVHHIRCTEAGLEICNLAGEADRCWEWGDLKLLSIGRVPLSMSRYYVTDTALHANPVPADQYLPGNAMHGCEAWLLFEGPRRILRCDSEHLNYEYLGAEKSGSGTANFERVLAEIVVRASQAFLTPATQKYLTHGPLLEYDFADSAALQAYTVMEWLLSQQVRDG